MESNPLHRPNEVDTVQKNTEFFKRINTFSKPVQELISTISSMLMEPDIHDRIKENPKEIQSISDILSSKGLAQRDIAFVLNHYNLTHDQDDNNIKM
jgi:hypothetical protein